MKLKQWNDLNEWYRNPSHPLYLSDDACQQRASIQARTAKANLTRQKNTAAKLKVEDQLGKELASATVERVMLLISSFDYGIGQPRHANPKSASFTKRISKSQIYGHFAGTEKVYYTCKPYRIGELALCLVTIDIDNPGHLPNSQSPQAQQTALDLCQKLEDIGVKHLCQRSTNDNGFHISMVISFPRREKDSAIRLSLGTLRTAIAQAYRFSGCGEVCLKGVNFISNLEDKTVYGTLVRLPRISDKSEADQFLALSEAPTPFQTIISAFCGYSESSKQLQIDGEKEARENYLSLYRGTNIVSVSQTTSPKGRMWEAIKDFQRQYNRNPDTWLTLLDHYESLNLNTGDREPDREQRAREVWDHAQANYRPSQPKQPDLQQWTQHLRSLIPETELTYYKGRSLRHEWLAFACQVINRNLLNPQQEAGACPRDAIKNASIKAKQEGWISFNLNCHKKLRAIVQTLIRFQVIEQTRDSAPASEPGVKGVCRMFRTGANWIQAQAPASQAIRTPSNSNDLAMLPEFPDLDSIEEIKPHQSTPKPQEDNSEKEEALYGRTCLNHLPANAEAEGLSQEAWPRRKMAQVHLQPQHGQSNDRHAQADPGRSLHLRAGTTRAATAREAETGDSAGGEGEVGSAGGGDRQHHV